MCRRRGPEGRRRRGHSEAASWPHAPSISRPRVSRTVTAIPPISSRRTNSRSSCGRDAVHLVPGVGFNGMRLTCTSLPREPLGQQVRTPRLIVDVLDQRVLDRHATLGGPGVLPRGVEHLGDLPPRVDRDEGVTQVVVGRVQRDGQRHRQALPRELAHARNQSHGRHRDAACRHSQAGRACVGESMQGGDHRLVVRQRLPHAHEDDVGHPPGTSRDVPGGQLSRSRHDLLDDLRGAQVASEPGLTRRAERTVHPASRLAGHTHRDAVGVAHQHALDERPVMESPQRLAGRAAIGGELPHGCHQRRRQHCAELLALGRGYVGPRRRVGRKTMEVVTRHLVGSEGWQPECRHGVTSLGRRHVGEMTRRLGPARCGEGDLARRKRPWRLEVLGHVTGPGRRVAAATT